MSVGEVGEEDSATDHPPAIEAELRADEEVRRTWTASNVRWANQWRTLSDAPTYFAATDRRVIYATDEGTSSIGYDHVRAVETDSAGEDLDLSTAFLACGGLCLLVGLVVVTRDVANGAGLVFLSVVLLVAGRAVEDDAERATVTVVIDNERQRLSFSADESVGAELAGLVGD